MRKVFFTSDTHFGHENVIRFDGRPFASVEEMDAELIRRWNAKVGKGDLVMCWEILSGRPEMMTLLASLRALTDRLF